MSTPRMQSAQVQYLRCIDKWANARTIVRDVTVVVVDETVAVRGDPIYREGKFFGQPEIICIEEGDEPSARSVDGQVARL